MKFKRTLAFMASLALLATSASASAIFAGAEDTNKEFLSSFEGTESSTLLEDNVLSSENMGRALSTKKSSVAYGVENTYNSAWQGRYALRVTGQQPAEGAAASQNVIYKDVNVKVTKDTQLSYVILPAYGGNNDYSGFDWEFTSQYIGMDLQFTDGTFLSDYGAVDQYGHGITGQEQGENGHLYSKQWNQVKSNIGEVAAGKTIDKIIIDYGKATNDAGTAHEIDAYIDDLRIREVDTSPKETPVEYANIFVGTNNKALYSRGLQWPCVMTPNGFNVWGPYNGGNNNWYPRPDNGFTSMAISHRASQWVGDFGTFNFGANPNGDTSNRNRQYNEDTMVGNPNYFSIDLEDGMKIELTPTEHASVTRFTFPTDASAPTVVLGNVTFNDDGTFSGTGSGTGSEGGRQTMYVYGEFDKVPSQTANGGGWSSGNAKFEAGTEEVVLKMATSFISADQAKHSLELEVGDKSFDEVKKETTDTWNNLMNTIQVEGASEEEKVALYSNIMRLYADPLGYSENTGTNEDPVWSYNSPYFRGTVKTGYKLYYNNGFWDTFRGSWSAYNLLTPDYAGDLLNGLVQHYIDSDWLARWLSVGGRHSMVGTSSDIIFGDAVMKGIDFDVENAYMASLKNASVYARNATSGAGAVDGYAGRAGMDAAPYVGFTDDSVEGKGLSWALDNYLNDWGVSKLAESLGHTDEAIYFENSSQNYVNVWNYGGGGWFVGRYTDGRWKYPNGLTTGPVGAGQGNAYDRSVSSYEETNGYTMTWQALGDVQGLINLYGGVDNFNARLDAFFTDETLGGTARDYIVDHYDSKLGQYGQANQPDHHIPYMYCYSGQPYKTQALTRDILERVYAGWSFGQGFPGDADNGQQSGWFIMSALGFYPISTGTDGYVITSPLYDKVTLNLKNGPLTIEAKNNSHDNVYIQSMTIDGEAYDDVFITYDKLMNAKEIVFEMGSEPSDWACDSTPPSITDADDTDVPNPLKDRTLKGVSITDAVAENDHQAPSAYVTNTEDAAKLFDNTNGTNASFTGTEGSVTYYFPTAQKIEMYTVSSATKATAPTGLKLYGSNDGSEWTELDSRSDVAFDWDRQLKPFAVVNDEYYNYYRLDMSGAEGMSVSEIELMSYPEDIISIPETVSAKDGTYTMDIVVDNHVTGVMLRDAQFNEITNSATVSEPVLNDDGTKTITVSLTTDPASIYVTAKDHNGYEITTSRKTVVLGDEAAETLTISKDDSYVTATFTNTFEGGQELNVVLGAYDAEGKLVDVSITYAEEVEPDGTVSGTISLIEGCTYKAFALGANAAPICEAVSLA
ncbi:GH92 family glycosyl hydrolase [Solibaculum mannosilyticum]|uniref:GH92 family glycosyl hydrolase n=1 Tax=Solibaculum mannosilyticum TaxID=2780922 RepID=UPI0034C377A9